MKKFLKVVMSCLLMLSMISLSTEVYADLGEGLNSSILNNVTANNTNTALSNDLKSPINKVLATVLNICKILGVGGIVYNGVKYMYAGADAKGKIKQDLIFIIIGTIFIFGADLVVDFIADFGNSVL